MFEIFCLMVEGGALTDSMRRCLFRGAQLLVENKERKLRVKNEDIEGVIETNFEATGFGSVYGILFTAEVWSDKGKSRPRYIVRTRDLEMVDPDEGFWMGSVNWESPSPEKAMMN
ncbi:MAG: hypothetical protein Q7S70_02235 [bacterium]|nr:hypothetical protein [bacterium]